ncbi:hypothetical protein UFOVP38_18 [uncultured Caudovirales phage]|uniref:Uncharacterized protein n=1 Tax=uncultured Caudovirales phage TaxID=2100421 RepID=A0A6J5T7H2_9CAUD|nr:hypothetical protein UFOVP38_18 [uncultured Caudovirales phage]
MAESFSYKFTGETKALAFEFSETLAVGEGLATCSCAAVVIDGVDPNPSDLLASSASIVGTKVVQQVHNGVAGVTYRLVATVSTSNYNTLIGIGDLPVYSTTEVQ